MLCAANSREAQESKGDHYDLKSMFVCQIHLWFGFSFRESRSCSFVLKLVFYMCTIQVE